MKKLLGILVLGLILVDNAYSETKFSEIKKVLRWKETARAGAEGCALTFITPNDRQLWNGIQRLIDPNVKQEFNTFKKSSHRRKKRFSRFKQRGNNENKPFKKNYFERSNNDEHRRKKKFRFKKYSRRGRNRAF